MKIVSDTRLVVKRDWITPYDGYNKGDHAPVEYWASKLGKDIETFIDDFKNGSLDEWFEVLITM